MSRPMAAPNVAISFLILSSVKPPLTRSKQKRWDRLHRAGRNRLQALADSLGKRFTQSPLHKAVYAELFTQKQNTSKQRAP